MVSLLLSPESFAFPYQDDAIDAIVPLRMTVDPNDIAEDWPAIARLRPGVTREEAAAETEAPAEAPQPEQPEQTEPKDES